MQFKSFAILAAATLFGQAAAVNKWTFTLHSASGCTGSTFTSTGNATGNCIQFEAPVNPAPFVPASINFAQSSTELCTVGLWSNAFCSGTAENIVQSTFQCLTPGATASPTTFLSMGINCTP